MFISRIDIDLNDEMAESFRRTMLTCGGIGLCGAGADLFEEWHAQLPAVCRAQVTTPDTQFVFVLDVVKNYLSEAEIAAVLAHEEGHYVNGDLADDVTGIVLNDEMEFAADAYAARQGHAAALIAALTKMETVCFDATLPALYAPLGLDFTAAELRAEFSRGYRAAMAPRIERLRAYLAA